MIGGDDFSISISSRHQALDLALRLVGKMWDGVVFEDAKTGELFSNIELTDLDRRNEILAYKTRNCVDAWREFGFDDSLAGTLIHVLVSDNSLTVVLDSPPSAETLAYLESLKATLDRENFAMME